MKTLTPEEIHSITNKVFQMEINVKSRKGYVPQGRACFYWYCRKYTLLPFEQIGKYMGNRNHSTVLHSIKTLQDTYLRDPVVKSRFEKIGHLLEKSAEQVQIVEGETPEQAEIRTLKKLLNEKEKEITKLRQRTNTKFNNEIKRMLSHIPQDKLEMFKTTRLIPFLKMNGGNVKVW